VKQNSFLFRFVGRSLLARQILRLLDQQRQSLDQQRQLLEQQNQSFERQHGLALKLSAQIDLFQQAIGENRDVETGHADLILRTIAESWQKQTPQFAILGANVTALATRQDEAFRAMRNRLAASGATGGGTELYLDLLEAALTGELNKDVSQAPWTKSVHEPARRAVGHDWPASAETMIGTARMRNLRMLAQRVIAENVPGDFIETGVWRGGACIYMRGILAAAGQTSRRVFVADSFRGLPPPDEASYPPDAGDPHHTFDQLAVSRKEVEQNFRRYQLLDEQVVFLEGWFKDTLHKAPIERLALLRLDGDMYESTVDALNALYMKVSPGGFVIVDDYVLKACAQAVNDFRDKQGITSPMHEVDGSAVWWQVPAQ
jgi:O-methyltransferase